MFFASKLAPTKRASRPSGEGNHDAKRAALDLLLILISGAPLNHAGRNSTGIWGVNRQGCRFTPQITGGLRAHRAWARCRVVGQERFAYFCAFQK
ncbi:hypothetical protein C7A12_01750 [Pseudomonas fluorescens]|nr:hypothetical protein C7A12_01750 [Pseudomonas fluorescens]PRW82672.1 hypothetical protein C7A13_01750 [Pseudomonas fluorescens]